MTTSKDPVPRSPATDQELKIVQEANSRPSVLVGRENDKIAFFVRVGKRLEVSAIDRDWLQRIGKKLGLIESTPEERFQFAEEARSVAKHGGRLSPRYWPPSMRRRTGKRGGAR